MAHHASSSVVVSVSLDCDMGSDDMVLLHNIITYYYYFGRAFNCLLLPWQVLGPYHEECAQGSPCVLFNLSSSVIMDYGQGKQYYGQCMT